MRLLGNINWWWPWPFNRLLPGMVYHDATPANAPSVEGDVREPDHILPVGGAS